MKMRNRKEMRHSSGTQTIRCPYCGSYAVYRSADGIYKENKNGTHLYVCSKYPACDSYVRVHADTKIPVGSMANQKLRTLRRIAHQYFDQLYLSGLMTKEDAYSWLAGTLQAPMSHAHIGNLGEYYCQIVIDESKRLLANHGRLRKKQNLQMMQGGKMG